MPCLGHWRCSVEASRSRREACSLISPKSSFASETPVTDGERVYCVFGNLGVYCFDMEGSELWQVPIEPRATREAGGRPHRRYYMATGSIWSTITKTTPDIVFAERQDRRRNICACLADEESNWATPYVWTNELRTEIVTPDPEKVRSYDLDGKLLLVSSAACRALRLRRRTRAMGSYI